MFNNTYQMFNWLADTHNARYSPRDWKGEGLPGSIVGTFKGWEGFGGEETYTVYNVNRYGMLRLEAVCDQDSAIRTVLWEDGRTDYHTSRGMSTHLAGRP